MELNVDKSLPAPGETMILMQRAKQGEREALNALLIKYEPWLHRVVHAKLGAELRRCLESVDIVQEAFVVASSKIATAEASTPAGIRGWLAGIAVNLMRDKVDYFSAQKRDIRRQVPLPLDGEPRGQSGRIAEPEADSTPPDVRVWKMEVREILDDAVSQLPERYREVVFLRDYAKADWREITQRLRGESVPAVKQMHQRAWIKIRAIARPRLAGRDLRAT